jgi:uncharacterized damage-inducible protein DinB
MPSTYNLYVRDAQQGNWLAAAGGPCQAHAVTDNDVTGSEVTDGGAGDGTGNGLRFGIVDPAFRGDERTTLQGFLQRQRDLIGWKVTGGDEEVLRRVSTPSGLTVHGVVRHLIEVERSWIRDVFAGQEGLSYHWTDADPDGDFRVPADVTLAELLAEYADEARQCDLVVAAAVSLDVVSTRRGFSLRWILLHLIEELARHLGQLDLLREQADGSVGEEPDA